MVSRKGLAVIKALRKPGDDPKMACQRPLGRCVDFPHVELATLECDLC